MQIRQKIALELERLQRKNLQQLHPLNQLFWESTLRCNVRCRHCGSDCKTQSQTSDMPLKDFLKVLDELIPHVDPHKVMIIVSGGEPLMREDLAECGRSFYDRGFPWGMVTNGLFLTQEKLDLLLRSGLRSVTVSLDGFEEEHNWLRGHSKSFEKASNAIKMIADANVVWDVATCVNSKNINYLDEFSEYLYSLGVRRWRAFSIDPMGRAKDQPDLLLSDSQLKQLLNFIERKRQEGKMNVSYSCEGFLGDYEGKVRNHLYRCVAGISVASVLIDGSISACTSIRGKYYQGNIYKDNFWDVWENGFQQYRNRDWMKKGICKDCKMFRYCEGNGMHLRDEAGNLLVCHYNKLNG